MSAAEPDRPTRLVALDGGPDIPLEAQSLVIGRRRGCDVRLESFRVSRLHCVLARADGVLWVRDLGSTNGTRINGRRVDSGRLRPGDEELPKDAWLDVDCDVLVPAAVSYCLTPDNQHRVRARWIVEAANMPTLPNAETALRERGVEVIPDFVANSGTNAWWWWTLFGDIPADAVASEAKVRGAMRALVTQMLDHAEAQRVTPREAAQLVVDDNLAAIDERFGTPGR